MKTVLKILFSLLFTYALLELGCFILLKTRFRRAHTPSFKTTGMPDSFQSHIAEIRPEWGMWHYPNQTMERKIGCLDFTIHTNSYGARDAERVKAADTDRVIFLGDSFIEGWGLNEKDRVSDLLGVSSDRNVLNFGCGWFTPTQEYLTYKYLAKDFSHDVVVWAILPFNDLNCDDTSFHESDNYIHYQPYFEGDDPNYHLMYREDDISKSTFNRENFAKTPLPSGKQKLLSRLREFTCWFNIYEDLRLKAHEKQAPSAYYDYKGSEIKKLFFIIKKMKEEVNGKKIVLLTLPVRNDFERYRLNKTIPLKASLDSFSIAEHITYIDMLTSLESKEKDPGKLYFNCDEHWNEYANRLAAEILLPVLKTNSR